MKKIILAVLIGLCFIVYGLYFFNIPFYKTRAAPSSWMNLDGTTDSSLARFYDGASSISLYAPSGVLYETQQSGTSGIMQFFASDPQASDSSVLPDGFAQSAVMERQSYTGNQIHYFYQQTIGGVPVYAATLAVHQQNGNQIYALSGNLATDEMVVSGDLTEDQAKQIALDAASKEASPEALTITDTEKVIFNGQAVGINNDSTNYLAYAVTVSSLVEDLVFGKTYIIDTSTGTVLFTEGVVRQALNRQVKNCNNTPNCAKSRYEGEPVVNIADVDNTYDILGKYHDLLNTLFSRDGYDGKGSPFIANVDIADQTCPNAWYANKQITLCKGLVTADIVSHEMTHAMNKSGPGFVYANQSGAIDEALADIFAYGVDGNWTSGEDSSLGVIRSLENPALKGQPDRLFSANYYCGTQDQGGVHKNGGILAKAFYLMVQGGTFNECTVSAIGREKAFGIVYKASTAYMTSATNYKTAYTALMQACGDLNNGEDSDTCKQVKNSLLAVEMDQQPDGQKGPTCSNLKGKKPECTTGGVNPTGAPTATTAPGQPTAVPTQPPGTKGTIVLNLRIRLQGIFTKPGVSAIPVQVKLGGGGLSSLTEARAVQFEFQADGTLKGSAKFENLTAGPKYVLYIKGPKHLQRKICDPTPVETKEGGYICQDSNLTLQIGDNTLDLAGILQLSGDIPDESGKQDGVINSFDITYVQTANGKTDDATLKRADLNYDGIVNGRDYSLIITDNSLWADQ